jgi:hypothetical protein
MEREGREKKGKGKKGIVFGLQERKEGKEDSHVGPMYKFPLLSHFLKIWE